MANLSGHSDSERVRIEKETRDIDDWVYEATHPTARDFTT